MIYDVTNDGGDLRAVIEPHPDGYVLRYCADVADDIWLDTVTISRDLDLLTARANAWVAA